MEDLSRFKQTYFDESAELLAVAESGLLRLTPGEVDSDEVNAIFRAVHSIKGGGGAFGFTELVAFAHEFETVMDGVRNNTIPVTTELVDTLIRANDVLGQMLAYAREDSPAPEGTTDGTVAALRRHQAGGAAPQAGAPAPAAAIEAAAPAPVYAAVYADDEDDEAGLFGDAMAAIAAARAEEDPVPPGKVRWTIVFRPKSDLLMSGNEPTFMLRALRRLGDAAIECHIDALPNLQNLEAELLHLSWTVTLVADPDVDLDKINDVFEFVADECDIRITAEAPPPALAEAPEAPPPAAAPPA
ncbi:Hpt domain-containing protein, partial [Azospirillum isscasi]